MFRFGVAILGAGASVRMGQPKLLLPWGKGTVISHLVEAWRSAGATQIAVVHSPTNSGLRSVLSELGIAPDSCPLNPEAHQGMFSSIHIAASWTGWIPGLTHAALSLGDQPQVKIQTLNELVEFAAHHPDQICQPARQGLPKHPLFLPWMEWRKLADHPGPTLREFLASRRDRILLRETEDEGMDFDLDTPADYTRALKWTG